MALMDADLKAVIEHTSHGYSGAVRVISPLGVVEFERPAEHQTNDVLGVNG